jgi:hypothetical protein
MAIERINVLNVERKNRFISPVNADYVHQTKAAYQWQMKFIISF